MTVLRDAVDADLDRIHVLNNEAVPAVSPADREHMARLVELATLAWVLVDDQDHVAAFVLLFEPGSTYTSPNYAWFCDRFDRFLYVDRVVVSPSHRGSGLGTLLYDAVAEEAGRRGSGRVTAEVNLVPPNPGSSRFHRRHGFEAVGTLELAEDYVVEMLERPIG